MALVSDVWNDLHRAIRGHVPHVGEGGEGGDQRLGDVHGEGRDQLVGLDHLAVHRRGDEGGGACVLTGHLDDDADGRGRIGHGTVLQERMDFRCRVEAERRRCGNRASRRWTEDARDQAEGQQWSKKALLV